MKKIGILTFSYGTNFGGTLQCVGLYNCLKKLTKEEIEVINYIPPKSYSFRKKYISGSGIKKSLKHNFFNIRDIIKRIDIKTKYVSSSIEKFDVFRQKNLNISFPISKKTIKDINNKYKAVIVGSDQVWNVINGYNEVYFLENFNTKKISYAPCSGRNFFKKFDEKKLKKSMLTFDYISARNKHTYDFIKQFINKEVPVVADPSILYDYSEFISKKESDEKYILTYILGEDIEGGNSEIIKKIKNKYGKNLKIISIGIPYAGSGSLQFYPWADEVKYDTSPEEWLNLINNAEFVYTDSYHGVLFSMKFHKKFLAYYSEKNRADRFIDLGERYEVKDWIINTPEELQNKNSLEKEINYEKIDFLLEKHRVESMEFLKKALGDV